MPDGNVANAYADIRADSSKLDGDLSKAKQLLTQRVRELEAQGKIPLSIDEQFFQAGLDRAAGEARALAAGGIILPISVNVDEAAAQAKIEDISSLHPIITADVVANDAAAVAMVEEIESLHPIVDTEIIIDPESLARVEDVEAQIAGTHPIVDIEFAADLSGVEALNGVLVPLGRTAEEVAAQLSTVGANSGFELAALEAANLEGLYHNVAVSVDEVTGAISVERAAIVESSGATRAQTAAMAEQIQTELAAVRAKLAIRDAALAAAQGEAELNDVVASSGAKLRTSELGFTRLGGSLALVGGQLLGLPPLLNLTLAVLGRDVVKIATKQLDALALSLGETKKAARIADTADALSTANAANLAADEAATQAQIELAAAEAARIETEQILIATNEELAASQALLAEGTTGTIAAETLVTEATAAQAVAAEAAAAAVATEAAANATAAATMEAAAIAEGELAAARVAATAASEAEAAAAFSSTGILIGLGVVIAGAAIAYKLLADDGTQKRIQEELDRTTESLEKQIDALDKAGGKSLEFGSQFADASIGFEVLSKSIEDAVGKKGIDKFNAALVQLGLNITDLPDLNKALQPKGQVDLSQLLPQALQDIPEQYRKIASDIAQQAGDLGDATVTAVNRAFPDDHDAAQKANDFFQGLSGATKESLDALRTVALALDDIDIGKAFSKVLNDLAVNGSIAEQQLAQALTEALNAGKIQVQDAVNQLNDLFKGEAFTAKTGDIFKNAQIDKAALDPNTLLLYNDALKGVLDTTNLTAEQQAALNEVTAAFGIDPVDALIAGKKAYEDNKDAIEDADKAAQKKAANDAADAKKAEADRKKKADDDAKAAAERQKELQAQRDQINVINGLIGSGDSAIIGLLGNVGRLNEADLDNLQKNLENLNGATNDWANSIAEKLFPTIDSLFGDKLTDEADVSLKKLTDITVLQTAISDNVVNRSLFIDPDKFANTLKVFGDVVANEGPAAAVKFFDAFRTATPEQRDAFEAAAANAQDAFTADTAKLQAEGKAIGEAIAPEIVKAINEAILQGVQSGEEAVTPLIDSFSPSARTIGTDAEEKLKRGLGLSTAQVSGEIDIVPTQDTKVTFEQVDNLNNVLKYIDAVEAKPAVDLTGDGKDQADALQAELDALNAARVVVPADVDTSAADAKIAELNRKLQALRGRAIAGSTILSFAGATVPGGYETFVNELGPEGWLPTGFGLDKMTIIGGGQPWQQFVAPGPGTIVDHHTTERIIAMVGAGGSSDRPAIGGYDDIINDLHTLVREQREIVRMQRDIADGPPQVHVHTNTERPHSHGTKVFWAWKARSKR